MNTNATHANTNISLAASLHAWGSYDHVRRDESSLNAHFAEILRRKHPLWRNHLYAEPAGVFADQPLLSPDIFVNARYSQPVVVETEYVPAATVEHDARTRLGLTPLDSPDPIKQAIAVRVPVSLRSDQGGLHRRIATAEFEYCLLSGDRWSPLRMPKSGWFSGGIDDIARCIEFAMVSQSRVDESIKILEQGVQAATSVIQDDVEVVHGDLERIFGSVLNQQAGEQTNRMAMTIIASALIFHSMIAGAQDIPTIATLRYDRSSSFKVLLLDTWQRILDEVNYWPIFKVASDLLAPIHTPTAPRLLTALTDATSVPSAIGVTARYDFCGRMFQKLIIDRKSQATFITLPTSSALLAELAVDRIPMDWNDLERYPDLRIADFSCGTGTLLSATYHSVLTRYRHAGGLDQQVHQAMIERAVVGADIMPSAALLCTTQLSSVHPLVAFNNTRVYTLPYGIGTGDERDRGVAVGSLDLINSDQTPSLPSTGQRQARGTHEGEDVNDINVPSESVDLVIMNPPFTRPTNHEISDLPVPSFAGFQTSADERRAMSAQLKRIRKSISAPVSHGNAGLATNFIDLAHAKVKTGGTIALVLPLTFVQGHSWKSARDLLSRKYSNLTIATIATVGDHDGAFSADTGPAEALVIATKLPSDAVSDKGALFVNLHRRPANLLEAAETAKLVSQLSESSATGRIHAGDQTLASYIRAPLVEGNCVALRESSLAATMIALKEGELRLPRFRRGFHIPVAKLEEIGERGLLHRDIGSTKEGQPPHRGPFKVRYREGIASYPMLWKHDAEREWSMCVLPDSEGVIRDGCVDKAVDVWQTATLLHFTLDFRLNSQRISACLSPHPSLGGRDWPNFSPMESAWEEVLALWANSSLGLMCFWWMGTRQQQGRSRLTISTLPQVLTIDPRALSDSKLKLAHETFERFQQMPLLPANEAYRDTTRHKLDCAVLVGLLDLPEDILKPLANMRLQWCSEPSVHGGKSTAPTGTA